MATIYCISYGNPARKQRMIERAEKVGLSIEFPDLFGPDTDEVKATMMHFPQDKWDSIKKCHSLVVNHLQMLRVFLATDSKYGIICEDDVYLRNSFKDDLPEIKDLFDKHELDILLLGYLINQHPDQLLTKVDSSDTYSVYRYPDDLWGTQMYMVSRKFAEALLSKYTIEWIAKNPDQPFGSDWIISKNGNRMALFPLLAVEEGVIDCTHYGQITFHRNCTEFNYSPDKYV